MFIVTLSEKSSIPSRYRIARVSFAEGWREFWELLRTVDQGNLER